MKKTIIYVLAAIGMLSSCENESEPMVPNNTTKDIKVETILFDQLIGLWKNEDGKSYERWAKKEDGSFQSDGFHLEGNDTVYTEQVLVRRENDQWISENTVMNQNDGKAIPFKIIKLSESEAHFNNPTHDFPTDIHYQLADNNTIRAFIAGPNQSGGHDTIPFNFSRVLNP